VTSNFWNNGKQAEITLLGFCPFIPQPVPLPGQVQQLPFEYYQKIIFIKLKVNKSDSLLFYWIPAPTHQQ
jgi:hypothetical protein